MTYDLKSMKDEWNRSVGRASGISFDIAMLLSGDPDELEAILSSSDAVMSALDRIKKQYDKAEKLVKFAAKFRKITQGHGALSSYFADRMRANRPPNMGGITEHFERAKHNPFNYKELNPFGWWNGVRGGFKRKPLPESKFPLVTSSQAASFREEDEKQRVAAAASMENATAAFYGSRNNQNWDDYLTGRTGDWSGYDPSFGPLGNLFRRNERSDKRRSAIFDARESVHRYEQEDLEEQRQARVERIRERRQRESRNSIAVRSRQIDTYRKFPWVKSLIDAGLIQKKELPKITKRLTQMANNPFLRPFVKNPGLAIPTDIYAAVVKTLAIADMNNQKVVDWGNKGNLYGTPSRKFAEAAYMAGLKDPGQISELYGKLTAKYGNADVILENIGSRTGKMSPLARMSIANSQGWNEQIMAIADIMSNNGHLRIDRSRRVAANKAMIEAADTMGWNSSSGWGDTAQSLWWSIPGMKSGAARDAADFKYVSDDLHDFYFKQIDEQIKSAADAAESANDYDAGRIGNKQTSAGTNVSKSVAFNIGTLQVDAENSEQLMQSLMKEGAERDHLGIIEATDTRIRV